MFGVGSVSFCRSQPFLRWDDLYTWICAVPCNRTSGKNQGGTSTNEHGRGFQPRCPELNVATASEGYGQLGRAWANGWVSLRWWGWWWSRGKSLPIVFNSSLAESSGVCQVVTLPNKRAAVYPVTIVLMCNMNRYFEVTAGYSILLLQLQLRDAWNNIKVWVAAANQHGCHGVEGLRAANAPWKVQGMLPTEWLLFFGVTTNNPPKTKTTNRWGQTDSSTRTKLPLWSGTWWPVTRAAGLVKDRVAPSLS